MERISGGVNETVKEQAMRVDREFRPLTTWREYPVQDAIAAHVPLDTQSKEKLAEWAKDGVMHRFWKTLEARETLYYRSDAPQFGSNIVMWLVLNDLCKDNGDVGSAARHYRAIRVRDVLREERGE